MINTSNLEDHHQYIQFTIPSSRNSCTLRPGSAHQFVIGVKNSSTRPATAIRNSDKPSSVRPESKPSSIRSRRCAHATLMSRTVSSPPVQLAHDRISPTDCTATNTGLHVPLAAVRARERRNCASKPCCSSLCSVRSFFQV